MSVILSPAMRMLTEGATFSPDKRYRYSLLRKFGDTMVRPAVFIMLNPSTADAHKNDPTITRCIGFAHAWGCDHLLAVNMFAFRSTDPVGLELNPVPVGPDNNEVIRVAIRHATEHGRPVVCAWSNHGTLYRRDGEVRRIFMEEGAQMHALQINGSGQPAHPLYLKKTLTPKPFDLPRDRCI